MFPDFDCEHLGEYATSWDSHILFWDFWQINSCATQFCVRVCFFYQLKF